MDKYVKNLIEGQLSKKKKKVEIEEIVDEKGNIVRKKTPINVNIKGITQKKTTDQVVSTAYGQMGNSVNGFNTKMTRYWGESDMSKVLGYKDTLGQDKSKEDADEFFDKELGLSDEEREERMDQLGYDEELPDDKVRLVEDPKKFIEQYIDEILSKRAKTNDIVSDENLSPILMKQLDVIKKTIDKDNVSIKNIIDYLKEDE